MVMTNEEILDLEHNAGSTDQDLLTRIEELNRRISQRHINEHSQQDSGSEQSIPTRIMTQAEQDYLNQLRVLQQAIVFATALLREDREVPASETMSIEEQRKQNRACNAALNEAEHVVAELYKQLPIIGDGRREHIGIMPQKYAHSPKGVRLKDKITGQPYLVDDETLLLRLADICSHTAQGLHFIATNSKPFVCDVFYATGDHAGTVKQITYDAEAHKAGMIRLSQMASFLKGSGWKELSKALMILAGCMLVAACGLAPIPLIGMGLAGALGGTAILTAGVGFFVGRDTGLAGAVGDVKMKSPERSSAGPGVK